MLVSLLQIAAGVRPPRACCLQTQICEGIVTLQWRLASICTEKLAVDASKLCAPRGTVSYQELVARMMVTEIAFQSEACCADFSIRTTVYM
jgi:hypothetical protein